MRTSIQLKGFKELGWQLNALSQQVQKKVSSKAVKKAAQLVQKKAQQLVPRDTGKLSKSIVVRKIRSQKKSRQAYKVGILDKQAKYANNRKNRRLGRAGQSYWMDGEAYYGRMIEFGYQQKHQRVFINGRFITLKKKLLNSPKSVPARPFLRPALGTQQAQVIEAMRQELAAEILKSKGKV